MAKTKPNVPTMEQWAKLYELAGHIKAMAPWKRLWDSDFILIEAPGREEPIFVSVIGQNEEAFGVGVYPGFDSYLRLARIFEADPDEPYYSWGFEQSCIMCYFGDREEIMPKEREIMKALNLRFRGRNQWPFFRVMRPGLVPWFIGAEEAELTILAMENFVMAFSHLQDDKLPVNFDEGEILLRSYSPEDGLWINRPSRMPLIPVTRARLIIDDQVMVARLKKQKRSMSCLELELSYLPLPVRGEGNDPPFFPRMILLADHVGSLLFDQRMIEDGESCESVMLSLLGDHIMKFGRPMSIQVRDDRVSCYIEDLCGKIGVKLLTGEGVPVIDAFLDEMLAHLDLTEPGE